MSGFDQDGGQPEGCPPEAILEWTYRTDRRVAIVASFQPESSVLIHMAASIVKLLVVGGIDHQGMRPAQDRQRSGAGGEH